MLARFRDPVLGPVSGERPMRATSPILLFSKSSFLLNFFFVFIILLKSQRY